LGNISLEAAIGLFAAIVVPLLVWCLKVSANLKDVTEKTDHLVKGSDRVENALESMQTENERLMRELIHYIKFLAQQAANGKPVPPPPPKV